MGNRSIKNMELSHITQRPGMGQGVKAKAVASRGGNHCWNLLDSGLVRRIFVILRVWSFHCSRYSWIFTLIHKSARRRVCLNLCRICLCYVNFNLWNFAFILTRRIYVQLCHSISNLRFLFYFEKNMIPMLAKQQQLTI